MSINGLGSTPFAPVPEPRAEPPVGSDLASTSATESTGTEARPTNATAAGLWARLTRLVGLGSAEPHTNLDRSGARREVAFGTNGRFTATPGVEATSPVEIGAGLYAAATLIDDSKENLFDAAGATESQRQALFATLREDLSTVAPGAPLPEGLDETQALQFRSSGATVLLELMTGTETPEPLKRDAFALYRTMIDSETNPVLRDGMVLNLHRLRDKLPADLKSEVEGLRHLLGPDRPPYDAWFADGNDTVKIDWVSQSHATEINKKQLLAHGFELVSEQGGTLTFRKTIEKNGVETKFEIRMRPHWRSNMYDKVGTGEAHMVVYSGHSDWGRNMRKSLENVDAGNLGENTLVFTELCVGKGEIQMFRDKFPKADLITTHNSSYFYPERDSEGVQAFIRLTEGIAARADYETMAKDVHEHNPFRYTHERAGIDNNFIFPTDLEVRRQVLDSDHDGQADIFDRLIDFDTFNVETDTEREFQPIEQPRPADRLVGTKVHFAAQTINRMALYSSVFEQQNSTGRVLPEGWFEPKPGENQIFRFEKADLDGHDVIKMRMNARYAHMSEEAARMAASYEYALWAAENEPERVGLSPSAAQLNALVFASHSLETDAGYRDREVWQAFLNHYGLPDIPRSTVERAKNADSHYYSGSHRSIDVLRKELDPEVLAALERLASPA